MRFGTDRSRYILGLLLAGGLVTFTALAFRSLYLLGSGLLVISLALSLSLRDPDSPVPKHPRAATGLFAALLVGSAGGMTFPFLMRDAGPSIWTLEFLYGWFAMMGGLVQLSIVGMWTALTAAPLHPAPSPDEA